MGSANAFIMVGKSDLFHWGINPTHCLILHENDAPWWTLTPIFVMQSDREQRKNEDIVIWIPTIDHMLEDALLMVGIYVLKDKELVALAKEYFKNEEPNRIHLYGDIEPEKLQELRKVCKKAFSRHKIGMIVAVTSESTILKQIKVLKNYKAEFEVCTPKLSRVGDLESGKFEDHEL